MRRQEYFQHCMDRECYRSKAWVIAAFGVVINEIPVPVYRNRSSEEIEAFSLMLRRDKDKVPYFLDPKTKEPVFLDEYDSSNGAVPAFRFKDPVLLTAGACINLHKNVQTTYGAWLFNNIICVYPFGRKIPYSANGYSIKEIERIIERRLKDDLPQNSTSNGTLQLDGDPESQPIFVSEYIKYNNAAGSLTGFTQLCVPAATPFALTTSPEVIKRRNELYEKYKGKLNDPVIQAKISEELVKLDREWINKDPDKGFFYADKSFDVVRKKMFMFQGAETGFGETGKFIPQSLDEGRPPEALPSAINAARHGSFSRGALTAQGGELTKYTLRIFQNSSVVSGDCGAIVGKKIRITNNNMKDYVGNYRIMSNGKIESLTDETIKSMVDTEIEVRSPMFCQTEGVNFCATCVGDRIAATPQALATYAGDVGSALMNLSMKAVHGKKLSLATYDPFIQLT